MKPNRFSEMVNRIRDLAFEFGTAEQFRDRVADLLGKYIHVEHNSKGVSEQTEASSVVVPVPVEEWRLIATLIIHLIGDEDAFDKIDDLMEPIGKAREERHGKGWIGVMLEEAGIATSPAEIDDAFACPPDALRANQGGAAT